MTKKLKSTKDILNEISLHNEPNRMVFFALVIIYLVAAASLSRVARSQDVLMLAGNPVPIASLTGVLSSFSNMLIILLVVLFGKKGLIVSLVMIIGQLPTMIMNMIRQHSSASLPGIFYNLLTIIAIIIIYMSSVKIKKYQDRINEQAVTDRLTGLPNRFACTELMNKLIKRGEKFAVISIDLNNFKSINDTMGHSTGNQVLIRVASRWKNAAEGDLSDTHDFIARLGGDEFALIVRDYDSDEDILKTIRFYESILENKISIDGYDYFITASFGYAEYPADADNGDALFTYSDTAMYEIKRENSTDHILRFRPEILQSERTLKIEREVRNAIENDSVYFNLQPQFDFSHKLRGFEALARIKDTNGNNISPGEFIPIAEQTGLIDRIDNAVFRKSAAFIGKAIKNKGADITLSINASVRHLMKNDFIDELKEVLAQSGMPAKNLEIEITESIMLDSADKALECIRKIKDMGIRIAIDDFGTGFSSLSYLSKVPADLLKIDKSFIDEMNTSESATQYVAAIIAIGHIMNMEVISEGVETQDQLNTLATIDCDYIQGFFWGSPMLAEEAGELI